MGYAAVGQLAVGKYCIGQMAAGAHIYTMKVKDPAALEYFKDLVSFLGKLTVG